MIEFTNVSLSKKGTKLLSNINLSISKQEHTIILGPNGAGKSLLLQLLAADQIPSGGTVTLLGQTLGAGCNMWDLRKKIGLVSRRTEYWFDRKDSVENVIASGFFGTYGVPEKLTSEQQQKVETVMTDLSLQKIRKTSLENLSDGEKTRTFLARVLVADPEILVLDEPFMGLDLSSREQFGKLLESLAPQHLLVYVCHHAEEILPCVKNIILLKEGQIEHQGDLEKVFNSSNLSSIFDVPLNISKNGNRWGWNIL